MTPPVKPLISLVLSLCSALVLSGCATNPVTGERELNLISQEREIAIGEQQYQPTLQTQGGRYYRDKALNEYVDDVGQSLAQVSDRPELPYEFEIINSGVPNAWALPGGKIAINRGLLVELDNEAQLASVLGHEVVHAAARHSASRMQRGMLIQLGVAGVGLGVSLSDNRYAPLIMGGAALGSQLIMAQYSRAHEFEADRFGMQYMVAAGYHPDAAVELQKTFVRLSEGGNNDFISGLFQSHPPSQARVEANSQLASRLTRDGKLYRERYQKHIAGLRQHSDAYEAHDKARKAMREDESDKALALIESAIAQVPNEAAFFNLRANILRERGDRDDAMADYHRAVELYPGMFRYRLDRGLLHRELENWQEAERDLKASIETVPTSIAYLGLGDAVRRQGRQSQAQPYYEKAAQDDGRIGQLARQRLEAM